MAERCDAVVNTSLSKMQFKFSKAARFHKSNAVSNALFYEVQSSFNAATVSPGFKRTESRFGY